MSWTKRELVREAFGELGLSAYEFDVTPEEEQTALRRLEAMLGVWEAKGIRVGYAFATDPGAIDPDTPSGLPAAAVETAFLNLALRLASGFGKEAKASTLKTARDGYDALLKAAAMPQEQQMPNTLPRGSGNGRWVSRRDFFPPPDTGPVRPGDGGSLDVMVG